MWSVGSCLYPETFTPRKTKAPDGIPEPPLPLPPVVLLLLCTPHSTHLPWWPYSENSFSSASLGRPGKLRAWRSTNFGTRKCLRLAMGTMMCHCQWRGSAEGRGENTMWRNSEPRSWGSTSVSRVAARLSPSSSQCLYCLQLCYYSSSCCLGIFPSCLSLLTLLYPRI